MEDQRPIELVDRLVRFMARKVSHAPVLRQWWDAARGILGASGELFKLFGMALKVLAVTLRVTARMAGRRGR